MKRSFALVVLLLAFPFSLLAQGSGQTKQPEVVAEFQVTEQSQALALTPVYTPKADGLYRISAYFEDVTPAGADAIGTSCFTVEWTDDSGRIRQFPSIYGLGGLFGENCIYLGQVINREPNAFFVTAVFLIRAKAGTGVATETSFKIEKGVPQYSLYETIEQMP